MSVENQASIFNRRASSAINKTGKKKREGGRDFEVERKEETEWLVSSYAPPRAMHWWLTQRRGVGAGLNKEEEKITAALTVAGEKELVCVGLLLHVWPLHNLSRSLFLRRRQTLGNVGETARGPSHLSPGQSPRVNESKGHRGRGEECSHSHNEPDWHQLTDWPLGSTNTLRPG